MYPSRRATMSIYRVVYIMFKNEHDNLNCCLYGEVSRRSWWLDTMLLAIFAWKWGDEEINSFYTYLDLFLIPLDICVCVSISLPNNKHIFTHTHSQDIQLLRGLVLKQNSKKYKKWHLRTSTRRISRPG